MNDLDSRPKSAEINEFFIIQTYSHMCYIALNHEEGPERTFRVVPMKRSDNLIPYSVATQ